MQQCDRGHCAVVISQNSICVMGEKNDEEESHPVVQSTKSESDEEDYESFFLQPASSPYNIKEKIAEANKLLLIEEEHCFALEQRENQTKVHFKEALVDFEPDLTDDDVQSIESYTEEITNEELKYVIQDNNFCDIIEEEVIEDSIESFVEMNEQHKIHDQQDEIEEDALASAEEVDEIEEIDFFDLDEVVLPLPPQELPMTLPTADIKDESYSDTNASRKRVKKIKKLQPHEINCKKHCIEELESRLELCISKLRLNEKPVCPTLKLHRRKCCGCAGGCKVEQKLPLYTGLHSEYGLSSLQIERLAKRKEVIKLKEEKERELSEVYRKRKIAQNEIIFRQWLKDISNRKLIEKEREKEIISCGRNYGVNSGSGVSIRRNVNSLMEKRVEKPRPKTANCITSIQLRLGDGRLGRRRRPHTTSSSTARILIEIPQGMLHEGFRLGDLFVQKQKFIEKKELHLATVS